MVDRMKKCLIKARQFREKQKQKRGQDKNTKM